MVDEKQLSRSTTLQELIDGGFIQKEIVDDYFRIMKLNPDYKASLFELVSSGFNNEEDLTMTPEELLNHFRLFCDSAFEMEEMEKNMDPKEMEERRKTARRLMAEARETEDALNELKRNKPTRH